MERIILTNFDHFSCDLVASHHFNEVRQKYTDTKFYQSCGISPGHWLVIELLKVARLILSKGG